MAVDHPEIRGLSEWRPLARGGFAVVWKARQLSLDREVAVKVYERELDEGYRRRFLREAAAARLSDHPGIVTVHDAGVLPDDRPYLIMDLWSGGSLSQWLKPDNRPSQERVRQVGVRIADALAAVHACGVLHRDVKPANILLDSFGSPGLADFGLATMAGAETTAADVLYVTPAYAPPEAFGMLPATQYGDVFSVAATLYALLAGCPPRDVRGAYVALEQMVEIAKRPIGPVPGVNGHLMDVLMTALSNDPAARPTAATFRDQLANLPRISKGGTLVGAAGDASSVCSTQALHSFRACCDFEQPQYCSQGGNSGFEPSAWPGGVRRCTTTARKTPRRHFRPGCGLGHFDRAHDSLADQRAHSVGRSYRNDAEFNPRPIVVERRSVTSLRP